MQKESESFQHSNAPILSSARFDEDSIIVYPLLSIVTAGLYFSGFEYFALIPASVLVMIFVVEASERVILVPLKKAQVLGNRCMVMKRVSYGENGVVKIIDNSGVSQWELWSAHSNYDFEEGSIARVKKVDGLFLQIEPL